MKKIVHLPHGRRYMSVCVAFACGGCRAINILLHQVVQNLVLEPASSQCPLWSARVVSWDVGDGTWEPQKHLLEEEILAICK